MLGELPTRREKIGIVNRLVTFFVNQLTVASDGINKQVKKCKC